MAQASKNRRAEFTAIRNVRIGDVIKLDPTHGGNGEWHKVLLVNQHTKAGTNHPRTTIKLNDNAPARKFVGNAIVARSI
jgi:hypothetical protein